jgi:hypothetical protein
MATQFYSALHYLNTHHDFVPVNNSGPVSDPQGSLVACKLLTSSVTPDTPEQFAGIPGPSHFSDFSREEGISSGPYIEDEGD